MGQPYYWQILSVLKSRIDQGFDHGNEGLRQVCLQFLASMIICQSGSSENEDDSDYQVKVCFSFNPLGLTCNCSFTSSIH